MRNQTISALLFLCTVALFFGCAEESQARFNIGDAPFSKCAEYYTPVSEQECVFDFKTYPQSSTYIDNASPCYNLPLPYGSAKKTITLYKLRLDVNVKVYGGSVDGDTLSGGVHLYYGANCSGSYKIIPHLVIQHGTSATQGRTIINATVPPSIDQGQQVFSVLFTGSTNSYVLLYIDGYNRK